MPSRSPPVAAPEGLTMRIIAGQHKGRKLLPPAGKDTTRPITASAKKSLFDTFADALPDAVVLDLYCGTGTLGLEALSRGARLCCFAERDPGALVRLEKNIRTVGLEQRCVIWRGDVEERLAGWLTKIAGPVDLVFVDPPYRRAARWHWPAAARKIFSPLAAKLAAGGQVVLRSSVRLKVPQVLGGLAVRRSKRYGDMAVTIYCRRAGTPERQER